MPTQQLERALRNAIAAGDHGSAQRIASELRGAREAPQPQQPAAPVRGIEEVQAEFDALPWHGKLVQAIDDTARLASGGATFGFRDKLAPYLSGRTEEEERQLTQEARMRAGTAGIAAETGGMMAPAMAIPPLAGPAGAALPGRAGGLRRAATSATVGGVEGAAFGGLDALGHNENVIGGQVEGAIAGVVGQAAAGTVSRILAPVYRRMRDRRTTTEELKQLKDQAYRQLQEEGVGVSPQAVDDLLARMDAVTERAHPGRHPATISVRDQTRRQLTPQSSVEQPIPPHTPIDTPLGPVPGPERPPATMMRDPVSIEDLDLQRQTISRDLARHSDSAESRYGSQMIEEMDDWMRNLGPDDVMGRAGARPLDEIVDTLFDAREYNRRFSNMDRIETLMENATRSADRQGSTTPFRNMRSSVDSILRSPNRRQRQGFNESEIEALDEFVRGTSGQEWLDRASRLNPLENMTFRGVGVGAGAGAGLAHMMGASPSAGAMIGSTAVGGTGVLASGAARRSNQRAYDEMLETLSSGRRAPIPTMDRARQDELARMLMMLGIQE